MLKLETLNNNVLQIFLPLMVPGTKILSYLYLSKSFYFVLDLRISFEVN